MSATSDRRIDRATIAAFPEEQLGALVRHVTLATERFQEGEIDAFDVDDACHPDRSARLAA